jgi:serine/threonine protein kinase
VAPEILNGDHYDTKVDIFSCGSVMYYLLNGKNPFSAASEKEVVANNFRCNINFDKVVKISKNGLDFLKLLLAADHKRRLSANEALHHPWFKEQFGETLYFNLLNNGRPV